MARKTAMGKEPGNVSIAIPESEKQRLREAGKRLPGKVSDVPNMAERIAKDAKPTPLKRLSPGVYRNSAGQLVGSKGQALRKSSPIQNALEGASRAGNSQGGMRPAPRPNQEMSQQEIDAAMQAGNLANSIMDQYNVPSMGNQIQSGYLQVPQGQQFQMPMQNLMYPFAQGQTPPDMRLIVPANPQGTNLMQNLQPQVAAQPNTVSGLLRRGR